MLNGGIIGVKKVEYHDERKLLLKVGGIKMIDNEIKKHFDILKEQGYIMIYNDNLAEKFKKFLDYINFNYYLDRDRNDHCPERNRFEVKGD